MKLGPIGIAGKAEQSVPSRHDHAQATEKRHRWRLRDRHGALSMQLAEQGGEGHDKNLFTEIIADVQGPAAPILQIGYLDQ